MGSIITVENLSKKYMIGHRKSSGYQTFRDTLSHGVKGVYQRLRHPFSPNAEDIETEAFWALKDINFEVKQGDRLGIIGRNGAGKSTFLKILSRITHPTTGRVHIKGRVASLLEVGTGFHPELTGRENIFLNAAILGMTKNDIKKKFDEIVDFAEVEKFLDTPVKHYSSGMYVRLAFAVASNLQSEILIVDEVLAVGDAQFQKKCLTKMEYAGKEGLTVIFVSHSIPTIASLCSSVLLLESGKVEKVGQTSEVIMHYYNNNRSSPASAEFFNRHVGDKYVRLLRGDVKDSTGKIALEVNMEEPITVEMTFEILQKTALQFVPNFYFYTSAGMCAFIAVSDDRKLNNKGRYVAVCNIPGNLLNEGVYFVALALSSFEFGVNVHFFERDALLINISGSLRDHVRADWAGEIPGVVRPKLSWETHEI